MITLEKIIKETILATGKRSLITDQTAILNKQNFLLKNSLLTLKNSPETFSKLYLCSMDITTNKRGFTLKPYMIWGLLMLIYFAVGIQHSFRLGVYMSFLFTLMQFTIYILSNRFLIPAFFEKNKSKYYLLSGLLLLITVSFFTGIDQIIGDKHFPVSPKPPQPGLIFPIFLHLVLCFVALWISIAKYLIEKEKKTKIEIEELKREKAESELKFLKTQINPHFLFNALNNVYTMTYIGDKSAHEKIAMLSDMLRYVLYDCESDLIPLKKEIDYIVSYIEFQQMKTEKKQNITFLCNIENENFLIAPMLLIPFIENGFKHSKIEKDKSGFVDIFLSQTNKKFSFVIKNSVTSEEPAIASPKEKGIGIENVKSRLNLLYPRKYLLDVRSEEHEHFVYLELSGNESRRKI